jgi:hypothetical protein
MNVSTVIGHARHKLTKRNEENCQAHALTISQIKNHQAPKRRKRVTVRLGTRQQEAGKENGGTVQAMRGSQQNHLIKRQMQTRPSPYIF